jgi:hypothetical protein
MSQGYVSDIICVVHAYIARMLEQLCLDERVRAELVAYLHDRIMKGYHIALDNVDFIMNVERNMKPTTQNHYFNENLQKA